ncbi:putative oxidoreductase-like protein, partial [Dinothrombium tinctorium]
MAVILEDLRNKVVLVTGSSSGIGEACAILFAKNGCKVMITGRNRERLANVASKCEQVSPFHYKCSKVIETYLQHETIVSIMITFLKEDHLPGITLSLPLNEIAKSSAFQKISRGNSSMEIFSKNRFDYIGLRNSQINASNIQFIKSLFPQCFVNIPKLNKTVHCSDAFNKSETIRIDDIFLHLTYFERDLSEKYSENYKIKVETFEHLLAFNFPYPFPLICLRIHTPELFTVLKNRCNLLIGERSQISLVTYTRSKVHLLESPFSTDCLNYSFAGLRSQQYCFANCVREVTKEKCKGVPPQAPLLLNEIGNEQRMNIINSSCLTKHRIVRNCRLNCSQSNCDFDFYEMKLIDAFKKHNFETAMILFFGPFDRQNVEYSTLAAINFTDLIIYISGTISLWFGFSMVQLHYLLDQKIFKIRALYGNIRAEIVKEILAQINQYLFIDTPDFAYLPALTIREEIFSNLNKSAFCIDNAHLCQKEVLLRDDFYTTDLSYLNILNYLIEKQFEKCEIYFFAGKNVVNCSEISPIKTLIYNNDVLFSIFSRTNHTKKYDRYKFEVETENDVLIRIAMRSKHAGQWFVPYVHNPYDVINPFKYDCDRLQYNNRKYVFQYKKSSYTLLEYPYSTNCTNYRSKGYISRQHCVNRCMLKMMEQKCNMTPHLIAIISNKLKDIPKSDGSCLYKEKITEHCYSNCSNIDCYSELYETKLKAIKSIPKEENFQQTEIEILRP